MTFTPQNHSTHIMKTQTFHWYVVE